MEIIMENKTQDQKEEFFSTTELNEILESLDEDKKYQLTPEDMEKIAAAWDKVEKKQLYKQ
jgi:hypothetical protein